MNEHTKGPWKWAGKPGESDLMHGEMRPGNVDSCVMRFEKYEGLWFSDYGANSRDEANAFLVEAAPELLEMLEELLGGMEASGGWEGDDDLFDRGMALSRRVRGES